MNDKTKYARAGALLAVSNMGHWHNLRPDAILCNPSGWCDEARYEVCTVAGHLMESDEHEEIFGDEAAAWEKLFTENGMEKMAKDYPHHAEWINAIAAM